MKKYFWNKRIGILPALLMLGSIASNAQASAPTNTHGLSDITFYLLMAAGLVLGIWAINALLRATDAVLRSRELEIYEKHGLEDYLAARKANEGSWWSRFNKMVTNAVPVEKERDILMDHNYDGIQELDNNLPPWWVYGFYLTIAIGVVYMWYYHISDYGKSSREEYAIEMEEAKLSVENYLATQADRVDESNVTLLTDEADLAAGKEIFTELCVVCHLDHGGGSEVSVGPNLTDKYWLHGGSIVDVFKTVKYGVPEKGMISWQDQLRPADMHQVSSYILSLQGTNPPDAKEPQGDLYVPGGEAETPTEEAVEN